MLVQGKDRRDFMNNYEANQGNEGQCVSAVDEVPYASISRLDSKTEVDFTF